VGAVALAYLLLRRRLGLALMANRDSETGARSLGVDVYRVKLVVYVVAAFGCALAGAVIYLIPLGLLAVAVALRARHGLWGLVADRTGVSLFPVRRRLVLPPAPPPAPAPAPGGSP
jgi:ABC-type branched-subunit amino acid transport system permease subunit